MHAPAKLRSVALASPDDFDGWRDAARALVAGGVSPGNVIWTLPGEGNGDLFAQAGAESPLPPPPRGAEVRVPRAFLDLARTAVLHCDPKRFALLYRLLWRLQRDSGMLEDKADDDVRSLHDLVRAVRRDIHKMRAFVRFREVGEGDAAHYIAWFEPGHHILRANASFFVNRFTAMNWSILTPKGSLHWDQQSLREGSPAERGDAPAEDAAEELWQRYYASIFNPARLKIGAMVKEMPRRYWKNLPEARLIPELIAGAQAREAAMVDRGASLFADERPGSLAAIGEGIARCTRCEIGCNGTRAVSGEGREDAALMIVGEQPGDCEEDAGRPFVGPAGQLLRLHLGEAGIDVSEAWLTNAVKHFKHITKPPQKRRLHQNPSAKEIDTCRWWIESEKMLVRPQVILALGASAARAMLGKTVSVQQVRGAPILLDDGAELWITTHPSYLLRLDDEARHGEEQRFAADLAAVARRMR